MKNVTQMDISKAARVSRTSVAMVLNGRALKYGLSRRTIEKVEKASRDLGYSGNLFASALKKGRSNMVVVVSNAGTIPIKQLRQHCIARELQNRNFSVILEDFSWRSDRDKNVLLDMTKFFPAGLIICDVGHSRMQARNLDSDLFHLKNRKIPLVLVDSGAKEGFDSVSIDREAAAYLATDHLLREGYREVYYTLPPDVCSEGAEKKFWSLHARFKGFRKAQTEHFKNREAGRFLLWAERPRGLSDPHRACDWGYLLGKTFLKKRRKFPAGIAVTNDQVAMGMMKALMEAGIEIPGEVGIIGSEDLPISKYNCIPISTVKFPVDALAKKACEMLCGRISAEQGRKISLNIKPQLAIRESSLRVKTG